MERIGLTPGSDIGGYRIVAPLGSGGMGAVYRAVDGGGTAVALKMLHPHVGSDAVARDRLRREVRALQKLRHPAVAAVLDAEADSTEAFIVTELVDGDDLETHVRERGPLDAQDLLDLAEGLRAALAAVHGAGVVHRDLKPSNVLVTDDGPVLIDFGIAQAAGDAPLTSDGLVIGTPGYLAPELLDGSEPTPASDFWGWAAVLAFAATGRSPFGTRPVEAVLARARAGDADLAGIGTLTATALRGALAPEPDDRTAPEDVVAALTVAATDGDVVDEDGTATTVVSAADLTETAHVAAPVLTKGAAVAAGATAVAANDGRTRAFAADDLALADEDSDVGLDDRDGTDADGWSDDDPDAWSQDDEDDPEGVDWIQDDLDASEQPGPEGSGYVRPPARRRWGTLLACGLLVGAAGALWPGVTLVVVVVVLLVVRTFGTAVESMHARRERFGVRRSDVPVTVAAGPWHLLRATVGLVPSVVVGASVLVIVTGVVWWVLQEDRWTITGSPAGLPVQGVTASLVLGGLVLLGVLVVWWGPLSRMTRLGARRALDVVAPGRLGAFVAVVVLLVVSAVLLALVQGGQEILWWPAPEPTMP
ncbi:serine/threonine-protein kinase [Cellulomonas fimi]|uniref:Serine/threonine protein kinase n=1 Tax=Cellulomonas fimi (strain ATCC 484 / DSM 20113 / JCM 1341 / CCUG 24087 / LMG 16345 / NBRC 15513 / NCIMB 8980 / NCTC 7547 / NRS-133) TaxID=590998 RepID=F4GYP0_CELFA|nr:serine/threonine-protein kinase [Cellulomonas fimi]AEE44759.1 serine/threonine protein kinase [Cellulomonas fimi ATCC 484]NNH06100.1 protein kinase [Cellulomonas fimi]VEH27213.1 Serine/threonine-protein kinase AfsK [Cellulomonas fimi]